MANDLILPPDYTFTETPQWKTIVSKFENGSEQRRRKWFSSLTKYKLSYKSISSTTKSTIENLFNNKYGAATSLTWTHPVSGATKVVRFVEDSLNMVYTSYGLYDIEFELQEVK